jgi:hypothetical protein
MNPVFGYIAAGALVIGFGAGWKVRDWRCDAQAAEAQRAAQKKIDDKQAELDTLATSYNNLSGDFIDLQGELRNASRETGGYVREIYRNVTVPASCAVPDSALRLLDLAQRRANAAAKGAPGPGQPAG